VDERDHDNIHRHRVQLEVAYNQRDLDAILDVYVENPLFVDYALQQTLTSVDEIREYVLAQWGASTKDEVRDVQVFGDGEWTVARFVNVGVNDGPFGDLPPSGRPFEQHFCNVTRWRDGKIVEDHLYFDFYGLMVQLGHTEPIGATPQTG
jgi:hypothetical protein